MDYINISEPLFQLPGYVIRTIRWWTRCHPCERLSVKTSSRRGM